MHAVDVFAWSYLISTTKLTQQRAGRREWDGCREKKELSKILEHNKFMFCVHNSRLLHFLSAHCCRCSFSWCCLFACVVVAFYCSHLLRCVLFVFVVNVSWYFHGKYIFKGDLLHVTEKKPNRSKQEKHPQKTKSEKSALHTFLNCSIPSFFAQQCK